MIRKFAIILITSGALFFSCSNKNKEGVEVLLTENIDLFYPNDIQKLEDTLVRPILYKGTISLASLNTNERKQKFIDYLLPAILISKYELEEKNKRITHIKETLDNDQFIGERDSLFLLEMFQTYKTEDIEVLLRRTYPHPTSLVLAQAALESGWGTSRFFVQGNNIFGVWSYSENEKRMPAKFARQDFRAHVRVFDDLKEAIDHYFIMMGRTKAYYKFRTKRLETDNPYELIPYLTSYSELGYEYVRKLETIIRVNNLRQYDNYRIHPDYFTTVDPSDSSIQSRDYVFSTIPLLK